jgi:hypothetical protein
MPKIDFEKYDKDDVSKFLVGDTVYWKDPAGKDSGNYEIMWMSDPPARQSDSTRVRLWNDRLGEVSATVGAIKSRRG